MLCVGIDGGGSGTRAWALDLAGNRFARAKAGASNPSSVGFDVASHRLQEVVQNVLQELGASEQAAFTLCAALAGVGRAKERVHLQQILQQYWPHARVFVTIDPHAALVAGTQGRAGVVLIAGTGSMAYGVDHAGNSARAGGFGYLLGDEGSGFAIGQAGLSAALAALEGRGPETALGDAAGRYFAKDTRDSFALPDWVWDIYQRETKVTDIAGFAREVLLLRFTDAVAKGIVQAAVQAQATLVRSVHKRLPGAFTEVVLCGGLFSEETGLVADLQAQLSDCLCSRPAFPPVAGAVLIAMRESDTFTRAHQQQWERLAVQAMGDERSAGWTVKGGVSDEVD